MGLLDKLKGKGRGQDGASADQPMDFDEMQAEADAKGLPTTHLATGSASELPPDTTSMATVADSSIISEAAPSEMAQ